MALYKAQEAARLQQALKDGRGPRAVLVFGNDVGGVREMSRRLVRAALGEAAEDDLAVEQLGEEVLADDPARLADEAQAISMFGSRRVVLVRQAGPAFLKAMKHVAKLPAVEALIIAEAPGLKKDAALARFFAREKDLAAIAVYEDDAGSVQALIDEVMSAHGLRVEPDARAALAELLGGDRAASRNELEKLALYCRGQERVRLEDVHAICADVAAHRVQDMLDAFFIGDVRRGCALREALAGEGMAASAVLAAAAAFVARLEEMVLQVAEGERPVSVVKKARVFFRRQNTVMRQLSLWTAEKLARADESIQRAMVQTRRMPELEEEIAERCLLGIALQTRRRAA